MIRFLPLSKCVVIPRVPVRAILRKFEWEMPLMPMDLPVFLVFV